MKLFDAQGLPKDGRAGPAGANGTSGSDGPAGPAIFLQAEDGEDGWHAIPGKDGANGANGAPGATGATGATGPAGPAGPALFLLADDGDDGMVGPPGPAGPAGGGITPTTLSAAILADSPFGFWKCDDASTKLADSSGNAFDLTTVTGSPNYAFGYMIPSLPTVPFANMGGANNSSVSVGWERASALGRTLPFTTWTMEFVFVPATASGPTNFRIIDWRTGATAIICNIYWLGGQLNIAFNNANNAITTPALIIGKPLHVVITCSTSAGTSTLSAYFNGVFVGSTTASASTASGGSPAFAIGDGATYGGSTGSQTVGYVALFSTVLSTARIAAHASAAGLLGL